MRRTYGPWRRKIKICEAGKACKFAPRKKPADLLDEVDTTKTRNDCNNYTESGKEPNKPETPVSDPKVACKPSMIPNWKRKKSKN